MADSRAKARAFILWVPNFQMSADGLTKAEHLIKTSHFALVQEQAAMQQRDEQLTLKLQSRAAAEQTRRETMESPSEATDDA